MRQYNSNYTHPSENRRSHAPNDQRPPTHFSTTTSGPSFRRVPTLLVSGTPAAGSLAFFRFESLDQCLEAIRTAGGPFARTLRLQGLGVGGRLGIAGGPLGALIGGGIGATIGAMRELFG